MIDPTRRARWRSAADIAIAGLLHEIGPEGHWSGELSSSALSTATAVMALWQVDRHRGTDEFSDLIRGGLTWLADHQREDGGWGDTVRSFSNISTTMLCLASLHAIDTAGEFTTARQRAAAYVEQAGGVPAIIARYGKDRTFSVPILTHAALAGLVPWATIPSLPFELACLPSKFYAAAKLPVVSYALPALIAIGQVRFHFAKPWNPFTRVIRSTARERSLKVLTRIQPENGGFLEAAPLTSFVTMSLAAMGLTDHIVVRRGVDFLVNSVRSDGSWPIDTNLATWTTTLVVNALNEDLPAERRPRLADWLLAQQYTVVHPYTNAAPGGWAWTDLPGGVPDADDTPGAILAILQLYQGHQLPDSVHDQLSAGVRWLVDLQNRDGGIPTFCRGWGLLPFDRSSADLTAHTLRAWTRWRSGRSDPNSRDLEEDVDRAIREGFRFLDKIQNKEGYWLPLWFGNQHAPDEINPVYGTSRVIRAYTASGRSEALSCQAAFHWLKSAQNPDGGWGGTVGCPSTVEETSLAIDALVDDPSAVVNLNRAGDWLASRVEDGSWTEPAPIGFYFAKLWYFEKLYPIIFAAAALRRLLGTLGVGKPAGRG